MNQVDVKEPRGRYLRYYKYNINPWKLSKKGRCKLNPEMLLHEAAEMLKIEAEKGLGTMFLIDTADSFFVTRTPGNVPASAILAQYRCQDFTKGLTANQWAGLLKKLWATYVKKN